MSHSKTSSRGVTTFFDDMGNAVVSIGSDGSERLFYPPRAPRWSSIKKIAWIQGQTLERIQLVNYDPLQGSFKVGDVVKAIVKMPSNAMVDIGCDRCVGPHQKNKMSCAANSGAPSDILTAPVVFDYNTGLPLSSKWEITNEESNTRCVLLTSSTYCNDQYHIMRVK